MTTTSPSTGPAGSLRRDRSPGPPTARRPTPSRCRSAPARWGTTATGSPCRSPPPSRGAAGTSPRRGRAPAGAGREAGRRSRGSGPRSVGSSKRTEVATRSSAVSRSPGARSEAADQTVTESSAPSSRRAPATTETATRATPPTGGDHATRVAGRGWRWARREQRGSETRTASCPPGRDRTPARPQAPGRRTPRARSLAPWPHAGLPRFLTLADVAEGAQHVERPGLRAGPPGTCPPSRSAGAASGVSRAPSWRSSSSGCTPRPRRSSRPSVRGERRRSRRDGTD